MNRSDQKTAGKQKAVESVDERANDKQLFSEPHWLKNTVAELQQPVAPSVAGQLRAARRTALAQEKNKRSGRWGDKWSVWGSAALAGLGVIFVSATLMMQADDANNTTQTVVRNAVNANDNSNLSVVQAIDSGSESDKSNALLEDLSIMAAQDELQFYQDLELLQWLVEEGELGIQG